MIDIKSKSKAALTWCIPAAYGGLFFDLPISNAAIILLLLVCVVGFDRQVWKKAFAGNTLVLLLLAFFFLHVIGLAYTKNMTTGWFVIEKKISILLMPLLVLPAVSALPEEERSRLKLRLGLITIASGVVFIIIAALKSFSYNYSLAFHRDYFATIPYVFYSIYFGVGSLLLMSWLAQNSSRSFRTLLIGLTLIFATAMLVLIGSKTGIIAFATGVIYFFYVFIKSRRLFYFFVAASIVVSALFVTAYPATLNRFVELNHNLQVVEKEKLVNPEEFTGLTLRLYFWKISLSELWNDRSLLTGVGTGDGQDFLDRIYELHGLSNYGYSGFDAHNQWVMTLIQIGMPGVVLLAAIFIVGARRAKGWQSVDFALFAWIIFCFSFSESLLESNKGVVFFALFFSILNAEMLSLKNPEKANGRVML